MVAQWKQELLITPAFLSGGKGKTAMSGAPWNPREGLEQAHRGFYKSRLIFKLGLEINEEPEEMSDNWGDVYICQGTLGSSSETKHIELFFIVFSS